MDPPCAPLDTPDRTGRHDARESTYDHGGEKLLTGVAHLIAPETRVADFVLPESEEFTPSAALPRTPDAAPTDRPRLPLAQGTGPDHGPGSEQAHRTADQKPCPVRLRPIRAEGSRHGDTEPQPIECTENLELDAAGPFEPVGRWCRKTHLGRNGTRRPTVLLGDVDVESLRDLPATVLLEPGSRVQEHCR